MCKLLLTIYLSFLFVPYNPLSGQCPDRGLFLSAITSPESITAGSLPELLRYESAVNCLASSDTLKGLLYRVISRNHAVNNDYGMAISYLKKAITVFRNLPDKKLSAAHIAYCYYFLQVYYNKIGLKTKSIEAIDSCIAIEKYLLDYKYTCYLVETKVYWLFTK